MKYITFDNCARCGEQHEDLEIKILSRHDEYTHWATCPVSGEPILVTVNDTVEPFEALYSLRELATLGAIYINGWELTEIDAGVAAGHAKFFKGNGEDTVSELNEFMFSDWVKPNIQVRWNEQPDLIKTATVQDVISRQRGACIEAKGSDLYTSDWQAYQDFIITHWAEAFTDG